MKAVIRQCNNVLLFLHTLLKVFQTDVAHFFLNDPVPVHALVWCLLWREKGQRCPLVCFQRLVNSVNKPSPVRSAGSSFAPLGSCISGIVLSCPARKEASVRKCLFFWSGQELASSRAVPLFASRNNAVASHPSTGARLFTWKNVPRIPLPGSKVRLGMEGGREGGSEGAKDRVDGLESKEAEH